MASEHQKRLFHAAYMRRRSKNIAEAIARRKRNPEIQREAVRRYWWKHRDTLLAKKRKRRRLNAARELESTRKYRKSPKGRLMRKAADQNRRSRQLNAGVISATALQRFLAAANGVCFYCKRTVAKLTLDHNIPLSRGGKHALDNLIAACGSCNSQKHTKTADEFLKTLGGG